MSFHVRIRNIETARLTERAAWCLAASAEQALAREDEGQSGDRREAFRYLHAQWASRADDLAELEDEAFAFPEDREVEFTDWH